MTEPTAPAPPPPGYVDLTKPGNIYAIGSRDAPWARFMTLAVGLEPATFFDAVARKAQMHYARLMQRMQQQQSGIVTPGQPQPQPFTEEDARAMAWADFTRTVWIYASLGLMEANKRIESLEQQIQQNEERHAREIQALQTQLLELGRMLKRVAERTGA